MPGKQFTDLTKASVLKDSDIFAVHDGNGLKKSSMGDVTAYMSDKFSNPNLLINSDFKINQRGQAVYNTELKSIYTVDRWSIYMPVGGSVKPNSDGTITVTNNSNDQGWFFQKLESKIENVILTANVISVSGTVNLYADDAGKTITNTGIVSLQSESGQTCGFVLTASSSITLKWVKLEQGSIATPFVAPNPAEELMKCQRFTHVIDTDCLLGISLNGILYVKVWTPIRAGATLTNLVNNMVAVINGNIKNLSVQEVRITEYNTYLLLFSIDGGGNDQRVPCALAGGKILLDAELY